jgi:glycosyltransferase involved in cell wall biosynthesis
MATITVFTPAYNSADTLPRVYESLSKQSSLAFNWLVVDDGSTDGTVSLITEWQARAPFRIDYFRQANGGKHTAHNLAVSKASTELFVILDADDELLPNAIAFISAEWDGIDPAERARIAGLWTLCVTPDGELCGQRFPQYRLDTTLQALRYSHRCEGERLPCFATEMLRQFPFPRTEPGTCSYIPEAYVWSAITRRHLLRFCNVICRVYHPGRGLSSLSRNEYQVSHAIVYGYAQPLANDLRWFTYAPRRFLVSAAQTVRYGLFSRTLLHVMRRMNCFGKMLVTLALPVGAALLLRDLLSGRIAKQLGPRAQFAARAGSHAEKP